MRHNNSGGMEVVSGDANAWNEMFNLAEKDLSYDVNYAALQQYLDIPEMIDYLFMIFYTGSRDAPVYIGNNANNATPRNIYAIRSREPAGKYLFVPWDCEWSLEWPHETGHNPPLDNRVIFNGTQNPHHLYQRLLLNSEFKILLADKIQERFFNNGVLTPDISSNRYLTRLADIDRAIIGESARWGDDRRPSLPYTRNVEWVTERDRLITSYFPVRTDVVLGYLRAAGQFPDFNAPVFKINGIDKYGGYVNSGDQLTMTTTVGDIYYTTDGTDPRTPITGTLYGGAIPLTQTTLVKARVYNGGQWSALSNATFAIGPVAQNLRITEIMYHPQDTNNPDDPNTEYIELKNIGGITLNLNQVKFTEGIHITIPNISLAAGAYIVVVKDTAAFTAKYGGGVNVAGQYEGSLDNAGERIRLEDAVGTTILDFEYKDGWRGITDGEGYSLTINNENNPDINSWADGDCWSASTYIGGTPGAGDTGPRLGDIVINEVLAHQDAYPEDWIELHNTTNNPINITGYFLSDDDSNLSKYQIASTTIPANGYIVFTEDNHFGSKFALSENGEKVCFTGKRDGYGNLTGYRAEEEFGASQLGVAFGRYQKSTDTWNFVPMSSNTPGASYQGAPNAYPKVGPLL